MEASGSSPDLAQRKSLARCGSSAQKDYGRVAEWYTRQLEELVDASP